MGETRTKRDRGQKDRIWCDCPTECWVCTVHLAWVILCKQATIYASSMLDPHASDKPSTQRPISTKSTEVECMDYHQDQMVTYRALLLLGWSDFMSHLWSASALDLGLNDSGPLSAPGCHALPLKSPTLPLPPHHQEPSPTLSSMSSREVSSASSCCPSPAEFSACCLSQSPCFYALPTR